MMKDRNVGNGREFPAVIQLQFRNSTKPVSVYCGKQVLRIGTWTRDGDGVIVHTAQNFTDLLRCLVFRNGPNSGPFGNTCAYLLQTIPCCIKAGIIPLPAGSNNTDGWISGMRAFAYQLNDLGK